MSTSSRSTRQGAGRRLLKIIIITILMMVLAHLFRAFASSQFCSGDSYNDSYNGCVNGQAHAVVDYWVMPCLFALVGTGLLGLLSWAAYELVDWLRDGGESSTRHCPLGRGCPCLDHQDCIAASDRSAALAAGVVIGTAIGVSTMNNTTIF